jgi:UPF0716 protein FxsA
LGKLFLLFTVVPLVDLYLLITIGGLIGGGPTLALVIGTGLVGATLARREGLRVWRDWQQSVARGEMPREGVTSSLLVLVGGVLLVTPGLITDAVGLTLLVPPARRMIAGWLARWAQKRLDVHTIGPGIIGPGAVIDVDAKEPDSTSL